MEPTGHTEIRQQIRAVEACITLARRAMREGDTRVLYQALEQMQHEAFEAKSLLIVARVEAGAER